MGCALIAVALSAIAAYFLYAAQYLSGTWAWIAAISAFTFLAFKYDKLRAPTARSGAERITEKALLLLALVGGTPGALLGMYLPPRHKTSKRSFQLKLLVVVAIQAAALYVLRPYLHF